MRLEFSNMEKYQIDRPWSLYQLSAFNFSKQLWAHPYVKQLMTQCIEEGVPWSNLQSTHLQDTLRAEISRKMDDSLLPKPVKKELWFIVESMGMSLCQWAKAVKNKEKFSVDLALYIDHICWTDYGSVDTSETVRAMYHSKVFPENFATWMELGELCLEDCLMDLWSRVSEIEKTEVIQSDSTVVLYWWNRFHCRLEEYHENFDGEYSLAEHIFMNAFLWGKYSAVRYFWELINKDHRKGVIIEITVGWLEDIHFFQDQILHPDHPEGFNFVIFWLKQLASYELNDLEFEVLRSSLRSCDEVVMQLLRWPCQDSFMEALENLRKDDWCIDYDLIVTKLLFFIDASFSTTGADSSFREILYEVRENIVHHGGKFVETKEILFLWWMMRDITWLDNIINGPHLKELRKAYVDVLLQYFARQLDSVFFDEFIAKVLVSEEEREQFRTDVAREMKKIAGIGLK